MRISPLRAYLVGLPWRHTELLQLCTLRDAASAIPPTRKKSVLSASAASMKKGDIAKPSLTVAAIR